MPINPERQAKAREYARIRHRPFALDLLITALALVLVLVTGLSAWLRDEILLISTNALGSTFLYFAVGFGAYAILFLPLTYYSSFVLAHRYGLSTQNLRAWLWDMVKGALLSLGDGPACLVQSGIHCCQPFDIRN